MIGLAYPRTSREVAAYNEGVEQVANMLTQAAERTLERMNQARANPSPNVIALVAALGVLALEFKLDFSSPPE